MQNKVLICSFIGLSCFLLSACYDFFKPKPHVHDQNLAQLFAVAGMHYPPNQIALLAFKQSKQMEIWAKGNTKWRFLTRFTILGASGQIGPKLREGDLQVPEGIYKIIFLNPNSKFHLSMQLNYPNEFDLKYAMLEHRDSPGSNIFIHGGSDSLGCLAMGDAVIEELYAMVKDTGLDKIRVIIAPYDMRKSYLPLKTRNSPKWLPELYANIRTALVPFTI